MADLPSTPVTKINDIEVSADAPITEALMRKYGIDVNAMIDVTGTHTTQIASLTTLSGGTVKTMLIKSFSASQVVTGGPTNFPITGALITTRGNPVLVYWLRGIHTETATFGFAPQHAFTVNGAAQWNRTGSASTTRSAKMEDAYGSLGLGSGGFLAPGASGDDFIHTSPILLFAEAATTGQSRQFGWDFINKNTFTGDDYLIIY